MDEKTVHYLNDLNRQFYETVAPSFHETRQQAWQGWKQLLLTLQEQFPSHKKLSVLDVGCGNARFGAFLAEQWQGNIFYHGIDNNPTLLEYAKTTLTSLDNLQFELEQQDILQNLIIVQHYDVVVLFGVIHHVPGRQNREQLLTALAQALTPQGILAFASWCFWEFERFQKRIVPFPEAIIVEEHDYLLDWQRGEQAYRYCHYVDEAEQQHLIDVSQLEHLQTFRADGKNNALNRYSFLQKPTFL